MVRVVKCPNWLETERRADWRVGDPASSVEIMLSSWLFREVLGNDGFTWQSGGRVRQQSKWLDISALGAPGQMNERGCEGVCF